MTQRVSRDAWGQAGHGIPRPLSTSSHHDSRRFSELKLSHSFHKEPTISTNHNLVPTNVSFVVASPPGVRLITTPPVPPPMIHIATNPQQNMYDQPCWLGTYLLKIDVRQYRIHNTYKSRVNLPIWITPYKLQEKRPSPTTKFSAVPINLIRPTYRRPITLPMQNRFLSEEALVYLFLPLDAPPLLFL